MGQRLLTADEATSTPRSAASSCRARWNTSTRRLHVRGDGGAFDGQGTAKFEGAEFELLDRSVRGAAQGRHACSEKGMIELSDVRYTACPPGNDDWQLARRRDLDRPEDAASARAATCGSTSWACRSSTRRGSRSRSATSASPGCCFRPIGSSGKSGTQIAVPWYWNIAPNYDATLTARWYSHARLPPRPRVPLPDGAQPRHPRGRIPVRTTRSAATRAAWSSGGTRRASSPRTRLLIDAANVSDPDYFEDFGVGFEGTSVTFLNRCAELRHDTDHWCMAARAQDLPGDRPGARRRRPAVHDAAAVRARSGAGTRPAARPSALVRGEATNFDRDTGPQGVRARRGARASSWRVDGHGAYLAASAALALHGVLARRRRARAPTTARVARCRS